MADPELEVKHAIEKLAYLLDDPATRADFANKPERVMESNDIDYKLVPDELVDTLAKLTPEEWEVLDRVKAPLTEANALNHGVQFI